MELTRCPFCFSGKKPEKTSCGACGSGQDAAQERDILPAGTLLNGCFQVGMRIHRNALLVVYLAWDRQKRRKVFLEEFFPEFLSRSENGSGVTVTEANRSVYATLASDLHDYWERLAGVSGRALLKTVQIFQENGTLYRVTEYRKLTPLENRLSAHPEPYDIRDARALMNPVISLLCQLHDRGMFHCGISPETILVDEDDHAYLSGFALPELRTRGSGIRPELFEGYSAPEQYSKSQWKGEWTDLYSVAAVMYRLLTGSAPVPAGKRAGRDTLRPLGRVRPDLPDDVVTAVMRGMAVKKSGRLRSMEQFSACLLRGNAATAVFRPAEGAAPGRAAERPEPKDAPRWPVLLILALSMAANLYFLFGRRTLNPEPPADEILVEDDLTGYHYETVKPRLDAMKGYHFDVRYEVSDSVPEGIIFRQSLQVGQVLPKDGSMTLYVCRGREEVPMPDLIGANESYAMRRLSDLRIPFTIQYDENPETGGENGSVLSCSIAPGEPVDLSGSAVSVTVTVKKAEQTY